MRRFVWYAEVSLPSELAGFIACWQDQGVVQAAKRAKAWGERSIASSSQSRGLRWTREWLRTHINLYKLHV